MNVIRIPQTGRVCRLLVQPLMAVMCLLGVAGGVEGLWFLTAGRRWPSGEEAVLSAACGHLLFMTSSVRKLVYQASV